MKPVREVQPIIDEIQQLAAERRRRLAAGADEGAAPILVGPVDLRAPVPIPAHYPLRRLLALADRVRRRILQAILIRQSEFNRQSSATVAFLSAQLDDVEREREQLQRTVDQLVARVADLDGRLCRAQALAAARQPSAADPAQPGPAPTGSTASAHTLCADPAYVRLAAQMRGDEQAIRERQRPYLDVFEGAEGPILDVGCGRGEFLELLREAGQAGRGVDLAPANVRRCREKGLDVVEADALEYLPVLADESLGGVFSSQFIEHLAGNDLVAFVQTCFAKLRPAARLVLETINADALAAMPIFFADPTHSRPIPPRTAALVLEGCGFREVEIRYASPFPPAVRLTPSGDDSPLAQRFDEAVDKLNHLLWGAREYAVIGTR